MSQPAHTGLSLCSGPLRKISVNRDKGRREESEQNEGRDAAKQTMLQSGRKIDAATMEDTALVTFLNILKDL